MNEPCFGWEDFVEPVHCHPSQNQVQQYKTWHKSLCLVKTWLLGPMTNSAPAERHTTTTPQAQSACQLLAKCFQRTGKIQPQQSQNIKSDIFEPSETNTLGCTYRSLGSAEWKLHTSPALRAAYQQLLRASRRYPGGSLRPSRTSDYEVFLPSPSQTNPKPTRQFPAQIGRKETNCTSIAPYIFRARPHWFKLKV